MDDSSMFLQWAMNQLQHQHPSAAAAAAAAAAAGASGHQDGVGVGVGAGEREAAFPSLQALRSASQPTQTSAAAGVGVLRDLTVQVDHRTSSWSSGDSPGGAAAMDHDALAGWSPHTARARTTGLGGGSNSRAMSWNFSAASAQPTDENGGGVALPDATAATRAPHASTVGRRVGSSSPRPAAPAAAAAASSSPGPVQDHIIAERRRREKINQRFIELSTVIPGLKKMDKATILGDAVKYVRELQEKVKTLEEDGAHKAGGGVQSAVVVKKPCLSPDDEGAASGSGGGLPEIEARLSDNSVLLRIHCDNARGLLVRLLSEVEKMSLAITHTNVMPFPASTAVITVTAKVQDGFNATVDEIVRRINSVLHQHHSSSSEEIRR